MSDILARIATYKRAEVAAAKTARGGGIEADARSAVPVRPFGAALARAATAGYALIGEIKKASPSRGLIRADFDPADLARAYEAGGAACLSVLTDAPSFQGVPGYLVEARGACALPVIRKDFMLDPWQVAEARAMGADAILVIMGLVDDALAVELVDAAAHWGMDALIEVHDAAELERALRLPSRLVGINNRDLRTFETRLETTELLAPRISAERDVVGESGLAVPDDLARLARVGVRRFLIGESLVRERDVAAATRAILAAPLPAEGVRVEPATATRAGVAR